MTPPLHPASDGDGLQPLALVATFLVLALICALAFAREAPAHQAPSGWSYPHECCHDQDCAPVDPRDVRIGADGYVVTVRPGTHPMVPADSEPRVYRIPQEQTRPSPDGAPHICISPHSGAVLCFFAGPPGA